MILLLGLVGSLCACWIRVWSGCRDPVPGFPDFGTTELPPLHPAGHRLSSQPSPQDGKPGHCGTPNARKWKLATTGYAVVGVRSGPVRDPLPTHVAGRASSKLSGGRRAALSNWDGGRSRSTASHAI